MTDETPPSSPGINEPTFGSREDVTVIIVSFNTRELTLKAIETLLVKAGAVSMRVVVWDNASFDGSADAIAQAFPEIELVRSAENIGFGAANNRVAETVTSEWILLLNPDTETHDRAVENLLAFAKAHPEAGIVGGRTVFPDGSLNTASCWNRMTVWSLFSSAVGLARIFPHSRFFNSEGIGGWRRDSVRHVDIVVGCFLMLRAALWRELGGFSDRYFMYGEESDLCLRAARLGYRPMVTPEAQIMHLVGASTAKRDDKVVKVLKAKATLIREHWIAPLAPVGIALLWLWGAVRRAGATLRVLSGGDMDTLVRWKNIWRQRRDWLGGY